MNSATTLMTSHKRCRPARRLRSKLPADHELCHHTVNHAATLKAYRARGAPANHELCRCIDGAITTLKAYRARESIMHVLWEQDTWLERHVKNAPPPPPPAKPPPPPAKPQSKL
jgi:hypothetical protein